MGDECDDHLLGRHGYDDRSSFSHVYATVLEVLLRLPYPLLKLDDNGQDPQNSTRLDHRRILLEPSLSANMESRMHSNVEHECDENLLGRSIDADRSAVFHAYTTAETGALAPVSPLMGLDATGQ